MNLPQGFKRIFEHALVQLIESKGISIQLKEGEVLMDVGQPVRHIPLLISGIIKIMRKDDDGNEIFLYYLSAHESCAMTFTAGLDFLPSEIKAIAEEDSELIAVPIDFMQNWLQEFPTWRRFVFQTIRNKLNELFRSIDLIAFKGLDEQLRQYLLTKSRILRTTLLNISHEEIAKDLATSRVVISRLLKKLETDKKILLYRQQIKLLNEL